MLHERMTRFVLHDLRRHPAAGHGVRYGHLPPTLAYRFVEIIQLP
jgi:hypothetical protein